MRIVLGLFMFIIASVAHGWSYQSGVDPMGRGTWKSASVRSGNAVTFSFPYGGPHRANLRLRIHPEYGRDVILSVPSGQFLCRSESCEVVVRFDDKGPERYVVSEPSDHSTNILFVEDYYGFLYGLQRAKRVRIEALFYQDGYKVFTFNVAGLKWERSPGRGGVVPYEAPDRSAEESSVVQEAVLAPPTLDPEVQHTANCITEGTSRGLSMDALTAFIRDCAQTPDEKDASTAMQEATKRCAVLVDEEKMICELKVSYCGRSHAATRTSFLRCMDGP